MKKMRSLLRNKSVAASGIFFAAIISLTVFTVNLLPEAAKETISAAHRPVLVIDAGHGGIDGGAIGADGSKESDINLAIALRLQAACEFYGVEHLMTRVDNSRGADALTYSEHAELVYRAELTNSVKNAVLMSIHQNYFPTAQPSGPQVIYSDNDDSKHFGTITHENLINLLDRENRRLAEPDKNNIYVLNNVNCPAILVECGFVSNHGDITKLTNSKYQTALSAVLLSSFIQYTSNTSNI